MARHPDLSGGRPDPKPRIAILVIAHANPATFKRLVSALRHPRISVFAHLDARADEARFREPGQEHVTFLAERQENQWGAFTQIEVTARLLGAAQAAGPFASHLLISGDTLPLVTNDVLVQAFVATPTVLRLHVQKPGDKSYRRLTDIYIPHTRIGRIRGLGSHLDRCLTEGDVQEAVRALRTAALKRDLPWTIYKGSQWVALSDAHVTAMFDWLRAHPEFSEVFRYSLIPDELFFHTLIRIVDPAYRSPGSIVEVDWSRKPKPYTLRELGEIEMVYASHAPFFRKFCDEGLDLVDAVLAARLDRRAVKALGTGPAFRFLRGTGAAVRLAEREGVEDEAEREDA